MTAPLADSPQPSPSASRLRRAWARLRGSKGWLTSSFVALVRLCGLTGLTLIPFIRVDLPYFSRLSAHVAFGILCLILFLAIEFRRFRRSLGALHALLKIPVLLLVVFSNFLPITGEMIIGWTSFVLFVDWRWTRRRLLKMGTDAPQVRQARRAYLKFAILLQCLLTGFYNAIACLSFMLVYHRIHGLVLPLLVVWFSWPRVARMAPPRRRAAVAGLLAFLGVVGWFYYHKQIDRSQETDLTRPDVLPTVERSADAGHLKADPHPLLGNSAGCGGLGCHSDLVSQWRGSTHRYAVDNAFFQKEMAHFIELEGTEFARSCINCHDPMAAVKAGAEAAYATGHYENQEGISCAGCHAISAYDAKRGNGLYTLKAPVPYPNEGAAPGSSERRLHDAALHLDPRTHLSNFRRRDTYRGAEYCVTCHLVHVPAALTGGPELTLHTLFDQWRGSPWADVLNCVDCHMPRFQMDENGYTFFDHRFLGSNLDLPINAKVKAEDAPFVEEFSAFTKRFLAGDLAFGSYEVLADPSTYLTRKNPGKKINPFTLYTIDEVRRFFATMYFLSAGPIVDMQVRVAPVLDGQGRLGIDVTTRNARVGHNFPSGPIDVQEVWLQAELRDKDGAVVDQIGALDAAHYVDPNAPILGSRKVEDAQGKQLIHHEFWKVAKVVGRRVLAPFASVQDHLDLRVPSSAQGPFTLTTRWNFRRTNQHIADWVWEGKGVTMPVTVLDHAEHAVTITRDDAGGARVAFKLLSRPARRDFADLDKTAGIAASDWWKHVIGDEQPATRPATSQPEVHP